MSTNYQLLLIIRSCFGKLYWNQQMLTCVRKVSGNCTRIPQSNRNQIPMTTLTPASNVYIKTG